MAPGSSGQPKLDGRNYSYWKAHMAGYLEALTIAWEVTENAVVGEWSEDQLKWNARAKNTLFDAGVRINLSGMLEQKIFCLMLLVRRFLLVFTAKRLLMIFGKSLRPFMLGLRNFVRKNTKCLRKNSMNSKCFQMNWLNKCMLD